MQVICVNGEDQIGYLKGQKENLLVVGNKYTVLREMPSRIFKGIRVYSLAELPESLYWTGYFAPVDGPDEVEIAEARQLDKERVKIFQEIEAL